METDFSVNPYYFHCVYLKESALNIHCHNSFVNRHTPKRCGPPPPVPIHTHECDNGTAPWGAELALVPIPIMSTMSSDTVILWELRLAGLFLSSQFHLCGTFVLGGWVVWWGLGCLPLQGPFSPLGRYNLPPGSGNFMSPGKTMVRALSRLGFILLPLSPPEGMISFQLSLQRL